MSDQASKHREWYHLIDGIRGFALINMLLFHFFYDVFIIFGQDPGWYHYPPVRVWQQFICITFLFISGISWHFSRNNLKRGLQLNLYGLIITAVTYVIMPSQTVWFGILNCIGCATLLMIPLHRLMALFQSPSPSDSLPDDKRDTALIRIRAITASLGLILALLLFMFTRDITDGYLGFGALQFPLPEWLYVFRPLTILGFPYPGFTSSDYFPVLPWFFLFLAGYWFWELVSCRDTLSGFFRIKLPVLSRLGQKTIWIYLLHQPLLYGAAFLLIQVIGIEL